MNRIKLPFFNPGAAAHGDPNSIDTQMAANSAPGTGPANDDELCAELENCFWTADQARRKFEPVIFGNYALFVGKHFDAFESDIMRYRQVPIIKPKYLRARISSNQILKYVRRAASIWRDAMPKQRAVAASSDQADIDAAAIATDLIEMRFHTDNEEQIRFNEGILAMICGRVWRLTVWDTRAGREGMRGNQGTVGEGDVRTETQDFWRCLVPPWSDSMWPERIPWLIMSEVRDVDELRAMFGKEVQPEPLSQSFALMDRILTQVIGDKSTSGVPQRQNAAILKQMFVRPSLKYPRGKYFIWAHGVLLRQSDLPSGIWPLTPIDWFPAPGRLYPMSLIECMDPLQRSYNDIISYWLEANARKLRGDMVIEGGGMPTSSTDPVTGAKIITITEGSKFYPMNYDLDTSLSQIQMEQLLRDFDDIAGIHQPTLGNEGRDKTLGEAQLLTSQDTQGIGSSIRGAALAYCQISSQKIQLIRANAKNMREINLPSSGVQPKVRAFYGADLRGTKDVIPVNTPHLTDAQILQARQALAEQNCFGPYEGPEDMLAKQIIARSSGIPGIDEEMDKLSGPIEELIPLVADIYRTRNIMAAISAKMQLQLALDPNSLLQAALAAGAQLPMPMSGPLAGAGAAAPGPMMPQGAGPI